jgi:hypothetical protein
VWPAERRGAIRSASLAILGGDLSEARRAGFAFARDALIVPGNRKPRSMVEKREVFASCRLGAARNWLGRDQREVAIVAS